MTKQEIRTEIKRRRAQYDLADCQRAGLKIGATCEFLLRNLFKPKLLMCYISQPVEAPTHDIIRAALARGQRVCVPWVDPVARRIHASEVENFTRDLAPGHAGILEPREACRRPVEPEDIEAHFVPGVAFDTGGRRIGRGAGYYDKFLALARADSVKVGLAFSWQLVELIPSETHDIPMDLVVTEQGIIDPRERIIKG